MPDVVGHQIQYAVSDLVKAKIEYLVVGSDGVTFEQMLPLGSTKVEKQSIASGALLGASDKVKLTVGTTFSATKAEAATKAAAEKAASDKAAAEAKAAAEKAANERTVTYIVEADGPIAGVTYTNFVGGQMGQEQDADEAYGPITKEYKFSASDFNSRYSIWSLGVGAQDSASTTTISCRILLNGAEVAKQTSTGPYSMVMCNKGGS